MLPILSQLGVTKVNITKKFGKENSKITSHRLNVRIPKRKGKKKSSFLFVHFFFSPQWSSYYQLNFENLWQKQSMSSQNDEN